MFFSESMKILLRHYSATPEKVWEPLLWAHQPLRKVDDQMLPKSPGPGVVSSSCCLPVSAQGWGARSGRTGASAKGRVRISAESSRLLAVNLGKDLFTDHRKTNILPLKYVAYVYVGSFWDTIPVESWTHHFKRSGKFLNSSQQWWIWIIDF